jgi:hypothetical protein
LTHWLVNPRIDVETKDNQTPFEIRISNPSIDTYLLQELPQARFYSAIPCGEGFLLQGDWW